MSQAEKPTPPRGRLVEVASDAPLPERVRALEKEAEKLSLLLEMSGLFASVKELDQLMALVAEHTTRIMNCERSSVFLLDAKKDELYSLVAQGLDVRELRFSARSGLAGYVAREGKTLNIADAYQDTRFNSEIDKATGFRTVSILSIPMRDRRAQTLGVVQCLNKKVGDAIVPFRREDELLLAAVASQVSFCLENTSLHQRMDRLFESFVEAISQAVDDRDPCTSGHSRRVALYALKLARAVHEARGGDLAGINYTRERLRQLRYAALLHDVGKIGVRECVLSKATKLPPLHMQLIQQRMLAGREKSRAACLEQSLAPKPDGATALSPTHAQLCQEMERAWKTLESANSSNFLNDELALALSALLKSGWIDEFEYRNLVVKRGNLTEEEWVDMRSHVSKSHRLLQQIPWPEELKDLPEIAYGHHEKRDGSGYPRKLSGTTIHFDSQIVTVADIYDALTAKDRPYKRAIPHDKARAILFEEEAAQGKILPELVELFFSAGCYEIV